MDNLIFFNPGDSIANFHDYDEAVRTAQIYRENHLQDGHVLVVKGMDSKTQFDIFLSDNEITHANEAGPEKPYKVSKKL
ncbi:hypothetical protein [Secundilactobacillus folii]|uniref:Uncharacterized protein n=1 Tax=Secundilactobacillus folii TaxID=2678357 RepID=A0A7X3C3I3_9LACO|nr:hypothetical protein [Secundilactobacillus folii]MTV82547.1 hypothetical protein [Secundilactobacillus folii]